MAIARGNRGEFSPLCDHALRASGPTENDRFGPRTVGRNRHGGRSTPIASDFGILVYLPGAARAGICPMSLQPHESRWWRICEIGMGQSGRVRLCQPMTFESGRPTHRQIVESGIQSSTRPPDPR
jgi:hypothetical protein